MKKSEAKPGTKVIASFDNDEYADSNELISYVYDSYGDSTLVGVIRSKTATPGKVWVKWIEGEWSDDEDDQEVDIAVLTLESERSGMEKEFKAATSEIKEKMKEAAKLVNEAGKLARKAHAKSLGDMYDAVSPLVNAMDNNGWRSSSWSC